MDADKPRPLSLGKKIAYSFGQVTDSIGFNVFAFFFLFFLTDVVGIPPAQAGTIALLAVLWDAIADLFVGQFSDNLKSKYGRRRPLMLMSLVPYALLTFLMFTKISASPTFIYIYYLVITMGFWTFYKIFVIPFFSLGAELTDDFNERTSVRVYASIFMYTALLVASGFPPVIVNWVEGQGGTTSQGWQMVGVLFALIIFITGLICWNFTRGSEVIGEKQQVENQGSLVANVKELVLLKPTVMLIGSVFFWSAVTSTTSAAVIYLLKNNLNFNPGQQSSFLIFSSVIAIVYSPLINLLSKKIDKRVLYIWALSLAAGNLLLFSVIGFKSIPFLIIYALFYNFGNTVFWTIHYSMMYDISEVDEFVYGKRREGAITALTSFSQKLGTAMATWLIGFLLAMVGYDASAAVINSGSQQMILYLNTLVPAIFGILSVGAIIAYPINKGRYEALLKALVLKRAGKSYSTSGFEKLLREKK